MTAGVDRRHVEEVLAERARLLAQPVEEPQAAPTVDVVAFAIGSERFAIRLSFVYRLERLPHVTPLPGAARHFAGVANLHGQVVPLVDLGVLFGFAPCAKPAFVVTLGAERADIGMLAETLLDVRALPLNAAASGLTVIDGAALLADPRLTHQEAAG